MFFVLLFWKLILFRETFGMVLFFFLAGGWGLFALKVDIAGKEL